MEYKIIGSSSKGNAVVIEDCLFDVGLSYKTLHPYLWDISFIFITHKHSDHFKKSTLNQIKKYFPNIQIITNYQVAYQCEPDFEPDITILHDVPIVIKSNKNNSSYLVHPFECSHGNILCTGYSIFTKCLICNSYECYCSQKGNQSFIYATDTNSLENAPLHEYDYFFLESNYDENQIKRYIDCPKYGASMIEGSLRHLSTQKCLEFYYQNRKPSSQLIELHKSSRFY